jgi:hypothetical protein
LTQNGLKALGVSPPRKQRGGDAKAIKDNNLFSRNPEKVGAHRKSRSFNIKTQKELTAVREDERE